MKNLLFILFVMFCSLTAQAQEWDGIGEWKSEDFYWGDNQIDENWYEIEFDGRFLEIKGGQNGVEKFAMVEELSIDDICYTFKALSNGEWWYVSFCYNRLDSGREILIGKDFLIQRNLIFKNIQPADTKH